MQQPATPNENNNCAHVLFIATICQSRLLSVSQFNQELNISPNSQSASFFPQFGKIRIMHCKKYGLYTTQGRGCAEASGITLQIAAKKRCQASVATPGTVTLQNTVKGGIDTISSTWLELGCMGGLRNWTTKTASGKEMVLCEQPPGRTGTRWLFIG